MVKKSGENFNLDFDFAYHLNIANDEMTIRSIGIIQNLGLNGTGTGVVFAFQFLLEWFLMT